MVTMFCNWHLYNRKEILISTNYYHRLVYGICAHVDCNWKYESSPIWNIGLCHTSSAFLASSN